MLRIANNLMGINSHRNTKVVSEKSGKSSEKLSSGKRINRAADDAAGLAISEKIRSQIMGLDQAQQNVQDGISLLKTADGGMNEISGMVNRQRELTIQAMNDTNTAEDKAKIQVEIDELTAEINAMAEKTEFNGIKLLSVDKDDMTIPIETMYLETELEEELIIPYTQEGTYEFTLSPKTVYYSIDVFSDTSMISGNSSMVLSAPNGDNVMETTGGGFQRQSIVEESDLGKWSVKVTNMEDTRPAVTYTIKLKFYSIFEENTDSNLEKPLAPLYLQTGANENQGMHVDRYDCRAKSLGIDPIITDPLEEAEKSLTKLDKSIDILNGYRAKCGAQQNRLEHTELNLGISSENLSSAESRIKDTDMAKEMMEYTKTSVLQQAGMAMLTQANQRPQMVMQLLQA